jgi:phosphoribosyl 1,2-cyclic phosphate phosphodiesterase
MKVRLLGCGTSSGVPRVGNDWGACDPDNPRNRRSRASILVENGEKPPILIDTSPDLREQLLAARVNNVAGVIWTHDHADHCHGIDDLRQLFHARGAPVDGYARPATLAALRNRFAYAFEGKGGYPPVVTGNDLPDRLSLGSVDIHIVDQPHGEITSVGLRFDANGKSIAYATDFNILTDEMRNLYENVDLWIVDALRHHPHPTHPHLAQTLGWVDELKVRRAILTHMDQSMDYEALRRELPANVEPGFDGLEVVL